MSYRMEYASSQQKKGTGSGVRRAVLTLFCFVCFLQLVNTFWPEGKEILKILLTPGDPETTVHAAEVFAQELGSGFPMTDAAKNFCITVLQHGNTG